MRNFFLAIQKATQHINLPELLKTFWNLCSFEILKNLNRHTVFVIKKQTKIFETHIKTKQLITVEFLRLINIFDGSKWSV